MSQVEEALTIKNTDIAKELCLPPVKLHCSSKSLLQNPTSWGSWEFVMYQLAFVQGTGKSIFIAESVSVALRGLNPR